MSVDRGKKQNVTKHGPLTRTHERETRVFWSLLSGTCAFDVIVENCV